MATEINKHLAQSLKDILTKLIEKLTGDCEGTEEKTQMFQEVIAELTLNMDSIGLEDTNEDWGGSYSPQIFKVYAPGKNEIHLI